MCAATYRLDEVARSICSSKAEFEANQPVIMIDVKGCQTPRATQIVQGGWAKICCSFEAQVQGIM